MYTTHEDGHYIISLTLKEYLYLGVVLQLFLLENNLPEIEEQQELKKLIKHIMEEIYG